MADIKSDVKRGIDAAADKAKAATDRAADAVGGAGKAMGGAGGTTGSGGAGATGGAGGGGTMDAIREGAHTAMDTATQYAGQARDAVRDALSGVGGRAGNVGDHVQEWASEAYHQAGDTFKDFGADMTTLVRRYPIPAVLIGFGVGLLLGRAARA